MIEKKKIWDCNSNYGFCETCDEYTKVQALTDPFVSEGILEPEEKEKDQCWCKDCYDTRRDDI